MRDLHQEPSGLVEWLSFTHPSPWLQKKFGNITMKQEGEINMKDNYDYEANYWKLLVKLITTFDKSPEANVDDYSTDMGALRHLVDRMLNKKESFDSAIEGARFYNKTL